MQEEIQELVKQLEEGKIDKAQFEARMDEVITKESDTEHEVPDDLLRRQELRTAAKRAKRL